jgi:NitT/TauT family transport system substrate-binding protein
VKKNPNTTQAVVNAMIRAVLWLRTASVDDVIATVPADYYGSDLALYRGSLIKNKEGYSRRPLLDGRRAERAQVLAAFVPEVQKAKIDLAADFRQQLRRSRAQEIRTRITLKSRTTHEQRGARA